MSTETKDVVRTIVHEKVGDGYGIRITDPEFLQSLREEINSFWKLGPAFQHYPGALPVALSRDSIHLLKQEPDAWRVTRKSNGVRYLLVLLSRNMYKQPLQVLVNRRGDMWLVKFEAPRVLHDGTAIEGELVQEEADEVSGGGGEEKGTGPLTRRTHVFYAFDVISSTARCTMDYTLGDRQKILRYLVNEIRPCSVMAESPFVLRMKQFAPLTGLKRFIEQEKLQFLYGDEVTKSLAPTLAPPLRPMSSLPSLSVSFYALENATSLARFVAQSLEDTRQATLHWLITQHASSNASSMDPVCEAWRHFTGEDLSLLVGGGTAPVGKSKVDKGHPCDGLIFVRDDRRVTVGTDRMMFKWKPTHTIDLVLSHAVDERLALPPTSRPMVTECEWYSACSMYIPKSLRPDKDVPNHIKVARATLLVIRENIMLSELLV